MILLATIIPNVFADGYSIRINECHHYPGIGHEIVLDDIRYTYKRLQWQQIGGENVLFALLSPCLEAPFITEEIHRKVAEMMLDFTEPDNLSKVDRSLTGRVGLR